MRPHTNMIFLKVYKKLYVHTPQNVLFCEYLVRGYFLTLSAVFCFA